MTSTRPRARLLRRPLVLAAVAIATLAACASAVPAPAPVPPASAAVEGAAADDRPNVVYILTDDMRADDLKWMPKTRRILGARGVTFTGALSPHPLCCPARAEILTGQYAQNNGVIHNRGRDGGHQALDPTQTIATWLDAAGYQTAFHGKYINGYDSDNLPDEPGWDTWDPIVDHLYDYYQFGFRNGDYFTDDYVTTRILERAEQSIRTFSAAGDPFYVHVGHVAPHFAYGPSWPKSVPGNRDGAPPGAEPAHAGRYARTVSPSLTAKSFNEADISDKVGSDRRLAKVSRKQMQAEFLGRIRSLRSVDDGVASLVRTLEETGELDNTWIVFTSDNGFILGEHRYHKKNKLYREVLGVPLLVSGPGVRAGTTSRRHATLIDVTATMMEAAGVTPTLAADGTSLRRHLAGKSQAFRDTTLVQTGSVVHRRTDSSWESRGVQTRRYLYSYSPAAPSQRVLYDRRVDPHEMNNVAADPAYRPVMRELHRRTQRLINCAGDNCNRRFGPVPAPRR